MSPCMPLLLIFSYAVSYYILSSGAFRRTLRSMLSPPLKRIPPPSHVFPFLFKPAPLLLRPFIKEDTFLSVLVMH